MVHELLALVLVGGLVVLLLHCLERLAASLTLGRQVGVRLDVTNLHPGDDFLRRLLDERDLAALRHLLFRLALPATIGPSLSPQDCPVCLDALTQGPHLCGHDLGLAIVVDSIQGLLLDLAADQRIRVSLSHASISLGLDEVLHRLGPNDLGNHGGRVRVAKLLRRDRRIHAALDGVDQGLAPARKLLQGFLVALDELHQGVFRQLERRSLRRRSVWVLAALEHRQGAVHAHPVSFLANLLLGFLALVLPPGLLLFQHVVQDTALLALQGVLVRLDSVPAVDLERLLADTHVLGRGEQLDVVLYLPGLLNGDVSGDHAIENATDVIVQLDVKLTELLVDPHQPGLEGQEDVTEPWIRRLAFPQVGFKCPGELLMVDALDLRTVLDAQELEDLLVVGYRLLGCAIHLSDVAHQLQEQVAAFVQEGGHIPGPGQANGCLVPLVKRDGSALAILEQGLAKHCPGRQLCCDLDAVDRCAFLDLAHLLRGLGIGPEAALNHVARSAVLVQLPHAEVLRRVGAAVQSTDLER